MHSKWKLWDFLKARPDVITDDSPRFIVLQTFSPYALKIIKQKIPLNMVEKNKLYIKLGNEIKTEWIDDNFKSLSLFGNTDSFFILNAAEMSKSVKEQLQETSSLMMDGRFLFLDYTKEDEFIKSLKKNNSVEILKIEAPAFWEKDKLLNCLCEELDLYLSFEARDYFIQQVDDNIEAYYNFLTQIKINFPEQKQIEVHELKTISYEHKWDQFELAELFCNKQFSAFYNKVNQSKNFEDLRQMAQFLQSHLLKISDTSYTESKTRLTKYDKSVLKQSEIWKSQEIAKAMNYFVELEIMAKSKNETLFNMLQKDTLRVL